MLSRIARRSVRCLAVSTAIVLVSADAPVIAQQTSEVEYPGWVFTPSIGLGGAWDSNVLLAGEVNPGDYGTPVSPSLSLDYGGRRTLLSTAYGGTYVMYRSFEELNSSEQRFRAFVQRRATKRLTLFAQESFTSAPTTDVLEFSGVPFYRVGSQTNVASGGLEAALSRLTTLRASYSLRSVSFEDRPPQFGGDSTELQGGYAHEVLVTAGRMLSRRLTLGGEYQLRRSVLTDGLDRFNMHTAAATLEFAMSPNVTMSASAGVARLGAGLYHDARTGPSVHVGIARRTRLGTASASYVRTFIPSFGFGGTFQNEELAASFRAPFFRGRAYAVGSAVLQDNDPLETDRPSLQSLLFSGVVGYQATRWLSLEGFYARTQQDNTAIVNQIVRNQLGFRVVAAKPLRIR